MDETRMRDAVKLKACIWMFIVALGALASPRRLTRFAQNHTVLGGRFQATGGENGK
jgi:hypothetical protein